MNINRSTITEVALAIRIAIGKGARDRELVETALQTFVEAASLSDLDELQRHRETTS